MPIRAIIENEFGPSFAPEDVAALTAAFEAALQKLHLVDRNPTTITVAATIL